MSRMQPVQPRSREMEIVRVLFDRHLLDRALNLAETRWPGSGDMIRLAYGWPDLAPAERRQALEDIGPERISEFRAFADLHPELAEVIDTLEARGGLSSPPEPVEPVAEAVPVEPEPAQEIPEYQPPKNSQAAPVAEMIGSPPVQAPLGDVTPSPGELDVAGEFEDFRSSARERSAENLAAGAQTLERIRARLDASARRLGSRSIDSRRPAALPSARQPAAISASAAPAATPLELHSGRFTPPPGYWLERLAGEQVVVVEGRMSPPTDDELVALANELGLALAEFQVDAGVTRQLFGGLARAGLAVETAVGPLPVALASPALVVIRGRLFTKQLQRLRAGFCDIPGTRATVRLGPSARVLILPA